jgi:hypothetical protein
MRIPLNRHDLIWINQKGGENPRLFGNLDELYFAMLTVNDVATFGSLSTLTVPPSRIFDS